MTARPFAALPELAVSSVAGFSVGPMVLLLAGQFRVWPVVVTGLAGALVAGWICGVRDDSPAGDEGERGSPWWLLAAVALVTAWVLLNVGQTAENVYGTRDPATYDITARWLMDNPTLHIHTHPGLFGSPAGFISESPGFSDVNRAAPGTLYSQGNHLQPALGAVVGWALGVQGLFRTNVVLGALALLALFALARRIVGGASALLVTAIIAAGMPMVFVSRDMYSEPLTMAFLMGGLALLHRAIGTGRRTDFALAGFVVACSAMVRIDSYLALLAVGAAVLATVALAREGERREAVVRGVAVLAGGAVPTVLGWLDVSRLSSGYYHDQHRNIMLELGAGLGLLVVGPVVVWVLWRPGVRRWLAAERTRSRLGTSVVVVLVAVFAFLLSRPLWLVRRIERNLVLETWQRLDGVSVDGTRSYYERTLNWLAEYFGWPTVLLGVAGYALIVLAVIRRRQYALIAMLTLGLAMSGLYLWDAQISPDQPWAMRRYVPVVLPLMAVAMAFALRGIARLGRWGTAAAVVLAAVALIVPDRVTSPMRHVRDEVPLYGQVQAICHALGPSGAVVFVDSEGLGVYGQTMRAYCGSPAIGLIGATPEQLQTMASTVAQHRYRLYVLARDKAAVPFADGASTEPFSNVLTQLWPNTINRAPDAPVYRHTDVYLGAVNAEGRVEPVPPAG